MGFLGYTPYLCISIKEEKDETLIENKFNYLIFSIMITNTMTFDEVVRSLQVNHYYVRERMDGLGKKNSKKLKNKFIKDNTIMSKSTYTVPETKDTLVVYAIKHIQTVRGKEYSTMIVIYYYKTFYNTYIVPAIDSLTDRVLGYMEYTHHSVERIQKRLHKDFDTFFKEDYVKNNGVIQALEYHYNGDENERVAHIGDAFAIMECENSGRRYVVKTVLSNEELYASQMMNKLNSKKKGEDLWREMDDQMAAISESHLKESKKKGILRAVA